MGWYNFYPENEKHPGNYLAKYQHTDDIHDMGSIAIKNDFSISFNGPDPKIYANSKGLQRNIALYRKYDDLRKAQYFSEEYREKIRASKWECHLKEKRGGKFVFVEKDYQKKKIYDLNSKTFNLNEFKNPFGQQTPFVRIEASLSSKGENPLLLLPLDESRDITEQTLKIKYPTNLNLAKHLALKVRVCGNNKENSAICIKLRNEGRHDVLMYVIETNFKGFRDFYLIETDNGDYQPKYPFDITNEGYHWAAFGAGFHNDKVQLVEVQTEGDMTGVKMSSIYAVEHSFDVLKNPTVKIGDSQVVFNCELKSTDFIEFDGKKAKIIDRYANETDIGFESNLKAPRGKFKAELTANSVNNLTPRAILTLGFTGKELK